MPNAIIGCVRNFEKSRAEGHGFDGLRLERPSWMLPRYRYKAFFGLVPIGKPIQPMTGYEPLFDLQDRLWRDGIVVWGALVQANNLLFKEGRMDHPGEMLYSVDRPFDITPKYLMETAHRVFQLKGVRASENPEEDFIGAMLANEQSPIFGLPVPRNISPEFECKISATVFRRKDLPGGRIPYGVTPALVSTEAPHIILPLPQKV